MFMISLIHTQSTAAFRQEKPMAWVKGTQRLWQEKHKGFWREKHNNYWRENTR
jgi:hypothetical protein